MLLGEHCQGDGLATWSKHIRDVAETLICDESSFTLLTPNDVRVDKAINVLIGDPS